MYVTRDEIVIAFNGNDSLSGLTTYSHFPFFNNVAFNQSVFTCTVGKQPANEPSITDDEQRVDKWLASLKTLVILLDEFVLSTVQSRTWRRLQYALGFQPNSIVFERVYVVCKFEELKYV